MALTIKQQMAKGSTWKAKEDFEIEVFSKAVWELQDDPADPRRRNYVQTKKVTATVPKGTTATILDKMTTYIRNSHYFQDEKLFVPIKFDDPNLHAGGYFVSWKVASTKLELVQGVQQSSFVFYSPTKGYFVKESGYWDKPELKAKADENDMIWSDKIGPAMKKKRMADCKQFLLENSGYYKDIEQSQYYVFEKGVSNKNLPADLIVQEIDKDTKAVLNTLDAATYLAEAFRLRPFTVKYGSAARSLFKDIEQNVSDYSALVMFALAENDDDRSYDETSQKVKDLKEEFKAMKLKKGDYVMKSDKQAVAFAFKNRADALSFRLSYVGDMTSQIIDPATLEDAA